MVFGELATGKFLNKLAEMEGLKRRFFETDKRLRARILQHIKDREVPNERQVNL
jgi:hypothetical protein